MFFYHTPELEIIPELMDVDRFDSTEALAAGDCGV